MSEKKSSQLPSIQKLAKDAWELFKDTWVAYLKLVGITVAYVFLAVIIGFFISLPITFGAMGSPGAFFSNLTPFNIAIVLLLAFWFILFFLSIIAVEIIFPIVSIFILQGKKETPIFDLVKKSKPFFWPFFLTILLSAFLSFGGLSLLIIPGLLIGFFFAFVSYEVVIDAQSGRTALMRSYIMVKNNFWEVLGRLAVLEIAIIVVSSVLQKLAAGDGIVSLVSFLFSLFSSWYARAYVYLLYKDLRAKTTFPAQIPMQWIWVVSAVGWVVLILFLVGLGFFFSHMPHTTAHNPSYMHRVHGNAV